MEARLPRSEKFRQMIQQGIPHSLRSQIWMRISGALEKKHKSDMTYKEVVKASSNDHLMTSKQIEKVSSYFKEVCNKNDICYQKCLKLSDIQYKLYFTFFFLRYSHVLLS